MAKTACTLLSALVIIAFSMTCELGVTGKPQPMIIWPTRPHRNSSLLLMLLIMA